LPGYLVTTITRPHTVSPRELRLRCSTYACRWRTSRASLGTRRPARAHGRRSGATRSSSWRRTWRPTSPPSCATRSPRRDRWAGPRPCAWW